MSHSSKRPFDHPPAENIYSYYYLKSGDSHYKLAAFNGFDPTIIEAGFTSLDVSDERAQWYIVENGDQWTIQNVWAMKQLGQAGYLTASGGMLRCGDQAEWHYSSAHSPDGVALFLDDGAGGYILAWDTIEQLPGFQYRFGMITTDNSKPACQLAEHPYMPAGDRKVQLESGCVIRHKHHH